MRVYNGLYEKSSINDLTQNYYHFKVSIVRFKITNHEVLLLSIFIGPGLVHGLKVDGKA